MSAPKANFARLQQTAEGMISKWGSDAVLRRSTGDRWCRVAITAYTPQERSGSLRNPVDRKALISVIGLIVPPDQEKDRLVTFVQPMDPNNPVVDEILKITEPPGKVGTSYQTIFYRVSVRK
jgi:hypothetical protein